MKSRKNKKSKVRDVLESVDDKDRAGTIYVLLHDALRLKDKPESKSFEVNTRALSIGPLKHQIDREAAFRTLQDMSQGNIRIWHSDTDPTKTVVRIQDHKKFKQDYKKLFRRNRKDTLRSITFVEHTIGGEENIFKIAINKMWDKAFRPQGLSSWPALYEIYKTGSIDKDNAPHAFAYFNYKEINPIYKNFNLPKTSFIEQQGNRLVLRKETGVKLHSINRQTFEKKLKAIHSTE